MSLLFVFAPSQTVVARTALESKHFADKMVRRTRQMPSFGWQRTRTTLIRHGVRPFVTAQRQRMRSSKGLRRGRTGNRFLIRPNAISSFAVPAQMRRCKCQLGPFPISDGRTGAISCDRGAVSFERAKQRERERIRLVLLWPRNAHTRRQINQSLSICLRGSNA